MHRPFKPADGALSGPQHVWTAARELSALGTFTIRTLHGLTNGVARSSVKALVFAWTRQGAVERVQTSDRPFAPTLFRVAPGFRDFALAPVVRRSAYADERGRRQEQLWTAMRTLPRFTIPELAFAASTDDRPIGADIARSYVGRLLKAGLVIALQPYAKGAPGRSPGAQAGVYRLKPSANTGPRAPRFLKGGVVFDPNREGRAA
jgi:hypothetical protein